MVTLILLILALICFILSAAGVSSRIGLESLGLAFITIYLLIGKTNLL